MIPCLPWLTKQAFGKGVANYQENGMDVRKWTWKVGKSGSRFGPLDLFFMALPLPIMLFYVLITVGCMGTSPGIPGLHLVSLSQNDTASSLNIGFFGLCLETPSIGVKCMATSGSTEMSAITEKFFGGNSSVPDSTLSMIATGQVIQSRIFAPVFPAAGALFLLGLIAWLLLALRGGKGKFDFGSPRHIMLRRIMLVLMWTSVAIALMASLATTQTAGALHYAAIILEDDPSKGVSLTKGSAVVGLQWTAAVLELLLVFWIAFTNKRYGNTRSQRDMESGQKYTGDYDVDVVHPDEVHHR